MFKRHFWVSIGKFLKSIGHWEVTLSLYQRKNIILGKFRYSFKKQFPNGDLIHNNVSNSDLVVGACFVTLCNLYCFKFLRLRRKSEGPPDDHKLRTFWVETNQNSLFWLCPNTLQIWRGTKVQLKVDLQLTQALASTLRMRIAMIPAQRNSVSLETNLPASQS